MSSETHQAHPSSKIEFLQALAAWDIAAESDDISRYFYYYDDVTTIESGSILALVGHKGAGKSAVAKWLDDVNNTNRTGRCSKLSFKNFKDSPIHSLIADPDDAQDQYKRLWYYIILSSICKLTVEDPDIGFRKKLYFRWKFRAEIKGSASGIRGLLSRGGGLSMFGTGFTLGARSRPPSRLRRVERKRAAFLRAVGGIKYSKPYYIIFDELDEEYKYAVAHGKLERKYHDSLIGLEKSIVEFHSDFSGKEQCFYPVMMLRTDIYDLLTSGNRNKFRDHVLDISWNETRIKKLLAFRISRSLEPKAKTTDILFFSTAWPQLFNIASLRKAGATPSSVFTYVAERTFMRPRDFIAFIKYAAKAAIANSSHRGITLGDLLEAETEYSDYLRREVEDAIGGLDPEFLLVIRAITDVGKIFPSQLELLDAVKSRTSDGIRQKFAVAYMLDALYYYNTVGRHHDRVRATFSYMGGGKFSPKWNLMVHKGLWRSLGLATANMDALKDALRGR